MSENLDLVRSIYAAWGRGDFSGIDWFDADIAWEFVGGPEPSNGVGVSALAAAVRSWVRAWDGWRVEIAELRELDDGRVFALTSRHGRGRASGMELDQMSREGADLFELTNDRVTRFVVYWDASQAFADLGLEE